MMCRKLAVIYSSGIWELKTFRRLKKEWKFLFSFLLKAIKIKSY